MINQGISATVDDKVDAYRANPNALAQRAKGSQDLLDLIALQRVNAEKEAARDQLQRETQPSQDTILDQLEAQAVGRTKEEMVGALGGIYQTQNRAKERNLNRVGEQGAATPQQLAGVQQGLGRVASRINPNIARARAGGIVGFSNGGKVINRDSVTAIQEAIKNKDEQALAAMGLSLGSFGGSTQVDNVTRVLEAQGWECCLLDLPKPWLEMVADRRDSRSHRGTGSSFGFWEDAFSCLCAGHHVDHLCRSPDGQRGGQHHQGGQLGFREMAVRLGDRDGCIRRIFDHQTRTQTTKGSSRRRVFPNLGVW